MKTLILLTQLYVLIMQPLPEGKTTDGSDMYINSPTYFGPYTEEQCDKWLYRFLNPRKELGQSLHFTDKFSRCEPIQDCTGPCSPFKSGETP